MVLQSISLFKYGTLFGKRIIANERIEQLVNRLVKVYVAIFKCARIPVEVSFSSGDTHGIKLSIWLSLLLRAS
jgi:hypothetical protein